MATEIWVNIGQGNGLLPDGIKPLPEHKGHFTMNNQAIILYNV